MALVSGIQYSTEFKGRKNAVINGNFDVWQRGTSHSTSLYGSADRWGIYRIGTGVTQTMSQQTFTLGQTDVPNNPKYYARQVVAVGTDVATQARMFHGIEGVETFAGETITISFWAKASAALDVSLSYYQGFGSGGSPSTEVQGAIEKVSLTTSWAKYTVTTTIPSISGKTLGTDIGTDLMSFNFWMSCGSNFATLSSNIGLQSGTFEFAQVQIERGDVATEFEHRSLDEETALCHRYFERINGATSAVVSTLQATSTTLGYGSIHYSEKRIAPSISYNALANFQLWSTTGGSALTATVITFTGAIKSSARIRVTVASGAGGAGTATNLQISSGGYLDIDAEL